MTIVSFAEETLLPANVLHSNCYLIYDETTRTAAIIDAGGDPTPVRLEIERLELQVRYILNTHGHFDHIIGNTALADLGAPFGIHPADRELLLDGGGAAWFALAAISAPPPTLDLVDELALPLGERRLTVLHTPGHTPGSVCFYLPEEAALFSGDTLFATGIGRSDFPGGNARALTASLKRLLTLPPATRLYPGHGPSATLERTRRSNPWLARLDASVTR